jgi:hypothetical protein
MIEKLSKFKITRRDGPFINVECNTNIINTLVRKINTLVDAVNELQKQYDNVCIWVGEQKLKTPAENVQPDFITTSYTTDGNTREYYGQNGASIITDQPLPAGYVITIRETETKGDDND